MTRKPSPAWVADIEAKVRALRDAAAACQSPDATGTGPGLACWNARTDLLGAITEQVDELIASPDSALAILDAARAVLRPLTVGEALSRPEVQSGEMVVEWNDGWWRQAGRMRRHPRLWRSRWRTDDGWPGWGAGEIQLSAVTQEARLIPADQADRDPGGRA